MLTIGHHWSFRPPFLATGGLKGISKLPWTTRIGKWICHKPCPWRWLPLMQSLASSWTCMGHTGQCPATRLPCCRVYLVREWVGTGMERKGFKSWNTYEHFKPMGQHLRGVNLSPRNSRAATGHNHIQAVYGVSSIKSIRRKAKSAFQQPCHRIISPPSTRLLNPSKKSHAMTFKQHLTTCSRARVVQPDFLKISRCGGFLK